MKVTGNTRTVMNKNNTVIPSHVTGHVTYINLSNHLSLVANDVLN